jgi:D-sedoheptulose 7-phosphate isomerase
VSLLEAVKEANRVYIIGNGGSYANAVHMCNDFLSVGVRAYTIDPATLTASANDFGYETVFARWINTVGEEGDLLIALSGSGTSRNILVAIDAARDRGMDVRLVTDHLKTMDMQQSEEAQIHLGHEVMRALKASRGC